MAEATTAAFLHALGSLPRLALYKETQFSYTWLTDVSESRDQLVCLALDLVSLQFERPGTYVVTLTVAGTEEVRSPFNVVLLPGAPPSGTPS